MPPCPRSASGARRVSISLLAATLALAAAARAATPPSPDAPTSAPAPEPWQNALRFEFNAASDEFARLHAKHPDDARLALGHAATLLARQPRTQSNIHAARAVFERIATAQPAGSTLALAARLLLARTAEAHLLPARIEEAREGYEQLLREHAGQPLADQAAVHLALLAAFPPPGEPGLAPAALHARIDALRAVVRTPEVIRELHALQGRLRLDTGESAAALSHFVAAREIGYRQPDRNADASLVIANLARETGDRDLATSHYEAFLRERPRDSRATTVRRYVAELRATAPASPAAIAPRP